MEKGRYKKGEDSGQFRPQSVNELLHIYKLHTRPYTTKVCQRSEFDEVSVKEVPDDEGGQVQSRPRQ